MQQRVLLIIVSLLSFLPCSYGQEDSVGFQEAQLEEETDPTSRFFKNGEKLPDTRSVILTDKAGKSFSLAALLAKDEMQLANYCIADLDNDGIKEMILYNFTGGAHCCDEISLYRYISPGKYLFAARLFGGHTEINPRREFEFSFDESFGYFFTCYACGLTDTSSSGPIPMRRIVLRYQKSKLSVVPGTPAMLDLIRENLKKLGRLPYGKLEDEVAMDEGQRKEVAMNLAVYYFSFGKNLPKTQQLFNSYYRFPDAAKVWAAFSKSLTYIQKENTF